MFKNYFKTAWRNLLKNKFYTCINIIGLTASLVVGILILLWVHDETSFDKFHSKANEIYRVNSSLGTGASKFTGDATPGPVAYAALQQLPEIKNAVRITGNYDYSLFTYNDQSFTEKKIAYTDPSLFTMFDFKLLKGNVKRPFANDNSVVVTASTAKRYFGNEDAVGKILIADKKENFVVTAIVADFPENSSIRFDMLFPMSLVAKKYDGNGYWKSLDSDWGNYFYNTFIQVPATASINSVAAKLTQIHKKNQAEASTVYSLQSLPTIHLQQPDGNNAARNSIKIFLVIAVLILAIGCINYVNLSTARAMLRSKEVSVRKIIGAGKAQLFIQFVIETVLIYMFVTLLALCLIHMLMPLFNNISGKNITFNFFDKNIWTITGLAILFTLAASSIYPALLLSSFEPLKALKGKVALGVANVTFRKVLVVTQFVFSVALIVGTVIISSQLKYIRSKELGYDKEHVLLFDAREMTKHYAAVKTELLKQPGITGVTTAGDNLVQFFNTTGDTDWNGKEHDRHFMIHPLAVDESFVNVFKMKFAEGTNFRGGPADSAHFILNETAVREAGIKDPIGKRFKLWSQEGTIIGVLKDFHFTSLKNKIEPAVFYYNATPSIMYVKTTGKDAPKAIDAVKKQWDQYNAGFPFQYTFLDETYNNIYKTDLRTGMLFNVFAVVAILISCLGLLGLATYTANIKTKEIGIRKVLGATITSIVTSLAKDFVVLVAIAIIIAAPLAYWAMNIWLQDFTYRIDMEWWMFVVAAILVLIIAMSTISIQAIKAALANPVKSLRTE